MLAALPAAAHELITTKLTWSKEISRIFYQRCASCHHKDGPAFSLLTHEEVRPWAKSIQEQTGLRQMPPWNAVKGFGELAPDHGLSQEEIATISAWVEGGAPEGDPNHLPPRPRIEAWQEAPAGRTVPVGNQTRIQQNLLVTAIELSGFEQGQGAKLYAELPSGQMLPLIWIHQYSPRAPGRYSLAKPLELPGGSVLHLSSRGPGTFALVLAE